MGNMKKQTTIKEDTGKLLLDLGKLVFAGLFLGTREKKNGENNNSPVK
jgi:hypothetical protein